MKRLHIPEFVQVAAADSLFSIQEASRALGLSVKTIGLKIKKGEMEAFKARGYSYLIDSRTHGVKKYWGKSTLVAEIKKLNDKLRG